MPAAKPPSPPVEPAPITQAEAALIKQAVRRFYGDDAVVRNWGPNPDRLYLHVETNRAAGMERYDCLGVLMSKLEREQIVLDVTRRGSRVRGNAKIAYRQGVIL